MFSSAFFRLFFSGTICPCSFAFPGDFLVFSSEELEAFCCRLRCCRFECVGLFVCGLRRFFSMPSTRPLLYNRSADLLPATPFSGDSVGVSAVASSPFDFAIKRDGSSDGPCASSVRPNFRRCVFVQIASLPVLQRGSFPFCQRCFFQRCFFRVISFFFFSALLWIPSAHFPQLQVR